MSLRFAVSVIGNPQQYLPLAARMGFTPAGEPVICPQRKTVLAQTPGGANAS
jgi:hypothetical protein